MRNVISILSFLFLCSLGTFANRSAEAAEAGGIVMQDKTSQSVDSERKSRASKRQAEMQQWKEDMTEFKNRQGKGELSSLADSIAFLQAHAAVSDSSFVLEADYLILRNGTRVMVNSGTTFISVDGDRGVVQVSPSNFHAGPNGVGGITVTGRVSDVKVTADKKGRHTYSMNIMGVGINARVDITYYPGNSRAVASVRPNLNSNYFNLEGRIVPFSHSTVFEGTSL